MKHSSPLPPGSARFTDRFLAPRIARNRAVTIPSAVRKCEETGRFAAFDLKWKPGMPDKPHIYWDSDVAKVLEGMANMLAYEPDAGLEKQADELIDRIVAAQQPDGYLNTYFTVVEPEKRWQSLFDCHELYCAGHLTEAAVAYFEATGKRKFLDAMCRYIDYIAQVFGRGENQIHGYPGHEELELALIRLYRVTGEKRYLDLCSYFIEERGREPSYFHKENPLVNLWNLQAEKTVRQMTEVTGHAVRAMYLYCGMTDLALETDDKELLAVCERLWQNFVSKRMYITGGAGSNHWGETFTHDYDLPNTQGYSESCASIGLCFWAMRLLNGTGKSCYADILEQTLFNGALSGLSSSGDKFFYSNQLEVTSSMYEVGHYSRHRQPWFDTSCCPTSYCRFLGQLSRFCFSESSDGVDIHIPVAAEVKSRCGFAFGIESDYPWDGKVKITVKSDGSYRLGIRVPGWCRDPQIRVNGEAVQQITSCTVIARQWHKGDTVWCDFPMSVELCRCSNMVYGNAGKVALKRGPVIYAFEECDNGRPLSRLLIDPAGEFTVEKSEIDGIFFASVKGAALEESFEDTGKLYFSGEASFAAKTFTAVPYALWGNRGGTDMSVWMREKH
ncbi:MAG: glycoside hydrolase family 127 protein [Lentisphaeria bacterium]|nr:glycoside hydrolase family 127 protein [Lentisphaeria bacterium]